MESACDVAPVPPAQAANVFATRSDEFREIYGVDIFGDCVHLYNAHDNRFTIRIEHLEQAQDEALSAVVKVLRTAGFATARDAAGHSLVSIVQLRCCDRGTEGLSMSRHNGDVLVAYH